MIKLIRHGLENRPEGQAGNFVFVEFNAWLYQGCCQLNEGRSQLDV